MVKSSGYNRFEKLGKILEYVNFAHEMMEKKQVTDRTLRNWLNQSGATSKYTNSGRFIEKKGKKNQTEYNMDDVKEMLKIDHNIDIDAIDDMLDPELISIQTKKALESFYVMYATENASKYDHDRLFREKVDGIVMQIKTAISLNILMRTDLDLKLYDLDEERILASAMQHANRQLAVFGRGLKENNKSVHNGDLDFYLKKREL